MNFEIFILIFSCKEMVEKASKSNNGDNLTAPSRQSSQRSVARSTANATGNEETKEPSRAVALPKTFEEIQSEEENDIMSHLDYRKLEMIYNDYNLMGGPNNALKMEKFLAVMLHHLPPPADRVALVRNLMELFEEIDVNGDEDLEWVEFTNHIID